MAVGLLLLAAFTLTACGNAGQDSKTGITVKNQVAAYEMDSTVSIEPVTLLDTSEVKIVADSLTIKNDSPILTLTLTNKLDTPISVQAGTIGFSGSYVNNYMVSQAYLGADLKPNETMAKEMRFGKEELMILGITQIGEIGLGVNVKHNQSYTEYEKSNYNVIFKGVLPIKTNKYDSADMNTDTYAERINDAGMLSLLNAKMLSFNKDDSFAQNGISIESWGLCQNEDGEVNLLLEMKNSSDSLVSITLSNVSLDGQLAYKGLWDTESIAPQKTAIVYVDLDSIAKHGDLISKADDAKELSMKDVKQVGFTLSAEDENSNTILAPTELELNF